MTIIQIRAKLLLELVWLGVGLPITLHLASLRRCVQLDFLWLGLSFHEFLSWPCVSPYDNHEQMKHLMYQKIGWLLISRKMLKAPKI